jgi:hypothetical protein
VNDLNTLDAREKDAGAEIFETIDLIVDLTIALTVEALAVKARNNVPTLVKLAGALMLEVIERFKDLIKLEVAYWSIDLIRWRAKVVGIV